MNFIFISPNFPHTYWQFCDRLHNNGVNVLGIGDAPYDGLEQPLKAASSMYRICSGNRTSRRPVHFQMAVAMSTTLSSRTNFSKKRGKVP